jgi:hypothetical protein
MTVDGGGLKLRLACGDDAIDVAYRLGTARPGRGAWCARPATTNADAERVVDAARAGLRTPDLAARATAIVEAIAIAERGDRSNPYFAFERGRTLTELHRDDDAHAAFEDAARAPGATFEDLLVLSWRLEALGVREAARIAFARGIEGQRAAGIRPEATWRGRGGDPSTIDRAIDAGDITHAEELFDRWLATSSGDTTLPWLIADWRARLRAHGRNDVGEAWTRRIEATARPTFVCEHLRAVLATIYAVASLLTLAIAAWVAGLRATHADRWRLRRTDAAALALLAAASLLGLGAARAGSITTEVVRGLEGADAFASTGTDGWASPRLGARLRTLLADGPERRALLDLHTQARRDAETGIVGATPAPTPALVDAAIGRWNAQRLSSFLLPIPLRDASPDLEDLGGRLAVGAVALLVVGRRLRRAGFRSKASMPRSIFVAAPWLPVAMMSAVSLAFARGGGPRTVLVEGCAFAGLVAVVQTVLLVASSRGEPQVGDEPGPREPFTLGEAIAYALGAAAMVLVLRRPGAHAIATATPLLFGAAALTIGVRLLSRIAPDRGAPAATPVARDERIEAALAALGALACATSLLGLAPSAHDARVGLAIAGALGVAALSMAVARTRRRLQWLRDLYDDRQAGFRVVACDAPSALPDVSFAVARGDAELVRRAIGAGFRDDDRETPIGRLDRDAAAMMSMRRQPATHAAIASGLLGTVVVLVIAFAK